MSYLNSEALLDLLVRERLLTSEQRQSIILNKGKQRLKLLKLHGRRQEDDYRQAKGFPDLVDIILSLDLETAGKPPQPISEEMIMLAVSRGFDIPFKKLDPLDLDMNVVTKTIPRSFAIRHLILPISLDNGV
ncbi:MAG: type II/IV secretion system protein, partial [Desulfobulbaceae bacterium]|nr:type II/IV secretion system protein [Desulfobulbaceae bacterium]